MSVIITSQSVFGPFKKIEVLIDRLRCDDAEFPFNVLGSYEISEDNSLAPAPAIDVNALASEIRNERDRLLKETDWSQVVDAPQTIKDKWSPYRQALRDVPQQPEFPINIIWPTPPSSNL